MGALIAGLAVLILLLLLGQGFVAADAKSLAKGLRITGGVLLSLLAAGLAVTGRIFFAIIAGSVALAIFTGGPMPWERFRAKARANAGGSAPRNRSGAMSRTEALKVLGLAEGASKDDIRAAYHRLIKQTHPDKGGSSYLAAKINEAKDVLLGE
jgi:hypothetical protein